MAFRPDQDWATAQSEYIALTGEKTLPGDFKSFFAAQHKAGASDMLAGFGRPRHPV